MWLSKENRRADLDMSTSDELYRLADVVLAPVEVVSAFLERKFDVAHRPSRQLPQSLELTAQHSAHITALETACKLLTCFSRYFADLAAQAIARKAKEAGRQRERNLTAILDRFRARTEADIDPVILDFLRHWFTMPNGISAVQLEQELTRMTTHGVGVSRLVNADAGPSIPTVPRVPLGFSLATNSGAGVPPSLRSAIGIASHSKPRGGKFQFFLICP